MPFAAAVAAAGNPWQNEQFFLIHLGALNQVWRGELRHVFIRMLSAIRARKLPRARNFSNGIGASVAAAGAAPLLRYT